MDQPRRIEILARGLWTNGTQILVCRNIEHGHCYLPGGHVEPGEAATHALAREFLEEAGETVRVGELCLVAEQVFEQRGKPRHEVSFVFHVERVENQPPTTLSNQSLPPRVTSREPEIAFGWLDVAALASGRFLPASMIEPLGRLVAERATGHASLLPGAAGSRVVYLTSGC
jgi:8-oxo-dGTP diphosphatase